MSERAKGRLYCDFQLFVIMRPSNEDGESVDPSVFYTSFVLEKVRRFAGKHLQMETVQCTDNSVKFRIDFKTLFSSDKKRPL